MKNSKENEGTSGFLPIERAWLDKLVSHGHTDTFRYFHPDTVKYSWWSYRFRTREKNAGWRIDYHFVSNNLLSQIKDTEIRSDVTGSDHCSVVLYLV